LLLSALTPGIVLLETSCLAPAGLPEHKPKPKVVKHSTTVGP
jgi:hypothetical protein